MARVFDAAAAHLAGLGADKMRDLGFAVQVEPGHGILHDPISVGDALVLAQMFPSTFDEERFDHASFLGGVFENAPDMSFLGTSSGTTACQAGTSRRRQRR
jgi:hypothetical protein